MQVPRSYSRAAWAFITYTLAVIAWGAFVRASLSGDGCGDHWPMCNGEFVPLDPSVETMIELTHRVTSGLAWFVALAFVVASRRLLSRGHPVRRGAALSFGFMTTEALIGAGIVLLRLVAESPELARGWWAGAHLANTFLLLAALVVHAWWASGRRVRPPRGSVRIVYLAALLGMLVLGVTGAIAALGDTIFPAKTLAEGIAQDLDPNAHLFIRLRLLHPILALAVAALIVGLGARLLNHHHSLLRAMGGTLVALAVAQVALGFLNVLLLAPVWLQLIHLALADALWILLILCFFAHGADRAVRST